jgi:hypothetical protein
LADCIGEDGVEVAVAVEVTQRHPDAVVGVGRDIGAGEPPGPVTEAHPVLLAVVGEDRVEIAVAVEVTQRHPKAAVGVGGDVGAGEPSGPVAEAHPVPLA